LCGPAGAQRRRNGASALRRRDNRIQ